MPIAATRLLEDRTVRGVAVAQQKAGSYVPRKRFNYLLRKPRRRGMLGDIAPHNPSATVSQDDHDVEQSKRGRHGDEHVCETDQRAMKEAPRCMRACR